MAELIVNKGEILPDTFPEGIASQEWIEAGYKMHKEIWWKVLQTLEIPDGFVDTSGTQTLGKNWQALVPQVSSWISIIDKTQDPLLVYCTDILIPYLEWIHDLKWKIQKISDFINFIWTNPGFRDRTSEEDPLLLWEVFKKQWAVCRHKSLMLKIVCDDMWIESWIRWWFIFQSWEYIRHLWNEVRIEGEWYVIDNAFQKQLWIFKYKNSNHDYYIREWRSFISLQNIWEWKKSDHN